jgi:hypothetical protein
MGLFVAFFTNACSSIFLLRLASERRLFFAASLPRIICAEVLVDVHLSAIYRELVAVHASSDDERATLAIECLLLIDRIIPEPELLLKMIATCDPPHPQVR